MKKPEKLCLAAMAVMLAGVLAWGTCQTVFADADSPSLNMNKKGSITVDLNSEGTETAEVEGTLALYKVADLSRDLDGNMVYIYTEEFTGCPWSLEDVGKAMLASEIASWLDGNAGSQSSGQNEEIQEKIINGQAVFSDLETGLYLVIQTESMEGYYTIKPFLVSIPFAKTDESGDSEWVYDVDTKPKTEFEEPQTEPDTETETETEMESESEVETEVETESEAETEMETESEAETEVETEPESESETVVQTEPESESEADPQTETESKPTLPQTGQLYWPIPVLTASGIFLAVIGRILVILGGKKKDRDA